MTLCLPMIHSRSFSGLRGSGGWRGGFCAVLPQKMDCRGFVSPRLFGEQKAHYPPPPLQPQYHLRFTIPHSPPPSLPPFFTLSNSEMFSTGSPPGTPDSARMSNSIGSRIGSPSGSFRRVNLSCLSSKEEARNAITNAVKSMAMEQSNHADMRLHVQAFSMGEEEEDTAEEDEKVKNRLRELELQQQQHEAAEQVREREVLRRERELRGTYTDRYNRCREASIAATARALDGSLLQAYFTKLLLHSQQRRRPQALFTPPELHTSLVRASSHSLISPHASHSACHSMHAGCCPVLNVNLEVKGLGEFSVSRLEGSLKNELRRSGSGVERTVAQGEESASAVSAVPSSESTMSQRSQRSQRDLFSLSPRPFPAQPAPQLHRMRSLSPHYNSAHSASTLSRGGSGGVSSGGGGGGGGGGGSPKRRRQQRGRSARRCDGRPGGAYHSPSCTRCLVPPPPPAPWRPAGHTRSSHVKTRAFSLPRSAQSGHHHSPTRRSKSKTYQTPTRNVPTPTQQRLALYLDVATAECKCLYSGGRKKGATATYSADEHRLPAVSLLYDALQYFRAKWDIPLHRTALCVILSSDLSVQAIVDSAIRLGLWGVTALTVGELMSRVRVASGTVLVAEGLSGVARACVYTNGEARRETITEVHADGIDCISSEDALRDAMYSALYASAPLVAKEAAGNAIVCGVPATYAKRAITPLLQKFSRKCADPTALPCINNILKDAAEYMRLESTLFA